MENNRKLCPYCGESIEQTARKCRFCGEWLPGCGPQDVTATAQTPVTQTPATQAPPATPEIPVPPVAAVTDETIEYEYPIERKYFSGPLLKALLAIGCISAFIDVFVLFSPDVYADLLFDGIDLNVISSILTGAVDITFLALMYQKFKDEEVTKPASFWILVGIAASAVGALTGMYMDDYNPSAFSVTLVLLSMVASLVVAGMFCTNPETRRIGIMTFVSLACVILVLCLVDDNPHHGKGFKKIMGMIYMGGYLLMYDAYRRYLIAPSEYHSR